MSLAAARMTRVYSLQFAATFPTSRNRRELTYSHSSAVTSVLLRRRVTRFVKFVFPQIHFDISRPLFRRKRTANLRLNFRFELPSDINRLITFTSRQLLKALRISWNKNGRCAILPNFTAISFPVLATGRRKLALLLCVILVE